jgi:preprotein translocase subunit YajC
MQVRNIDNLINAKCRELDELERQMTCLKSVKLGDKVITSCTDGMQKTIDKVIDLRCKINSEIDNLVDLKTDIRNSINKLDDNRYITVLIDYFVNAMTFDQIAESERYSRRQVIRIYGNALQTFEKDVLKCP